MGRIQIDNQTAYQVKNTCVELVPQDEEVDFPRSQRTVSDTGAPNQTPEMVSSYIPQTPSPFMQSQPDPVFMPYPMDLMGQMGQGISFGSFGVEDNCQMQPAFNCADGNGQNMYMSWDPNTGAFMPYEYTYMPYDASCYGMQEQGQMVDDNRNPEEHTQALLSALSEKIGESKSQVSGDCVEANGGMPALGNGEDLAAIGEMETWQGEECWEGGWGQGGNNGYYGNEDQGNMGSLPQAGRRRAERREAARRQGSEGQAQSRSNTVQEAWQAASEPQAAITTVMFRNIPNKYTREMLVKQLEEDMRGQFDFVYLPIDFKNKCNVGYAFINFRTVEACESFVSRFNGMEVRKCLPGLNSRKVTEVTPARVQGFEENVQRLRNSPVMRELLHKPEWMPLIFGQQGEKMTFPAPERSLEPIKPRRRARDDEARYNQDEL